MCFIDNFFNSFVQSYFRAELLIVKVHFINLHEFVLSNLNLIFVSFKIVFDKLSSREVVFFNKKISSLALTLSLLLMDLSCVLGFLLFYFLVVCCLTKC